MKTLLHLPVISHNDPQKSYQAAILLALKDAWDDREDYINMIAALKKTAALMEKCQGEFFNHITSPADDSFEIAQLKQNVNIDLIDAEGRRLGSPWTNQSVGGFIENDEGFQHLQVKFSPVEQGTNDMSELMGSLHDMKIRVSVGSKDVELKMGDVCDPSDILEIIEENDLKVCRA